MLVLSRLENESINVGDDITITVVRIAGNKVRIGIAAPEAVRIVRSELTDESCRGRGDGGANNHKD